MKTNSLVARILSSQLYQSLASSQTDVELWQDNHLQDDWSLFSIVRIRGGEATILAQLRVKNQQFERRVNVGSEEIWSPLE